MAEGYEPRPIGLAEKSITIDRTNISESILDSSIKCYQVGNVVFLQINALQVKNDISNYGNFLSELPLPINEIYVPLFENSAKTSHECRITTSGVLQAWYGNFVTTGVYYGCITYLTNS